MDDTAESDAIDSLLTVRDWLRHAVSRFTSAQLHYGHGTSNALDEAAFLILTKLELPIDTLEPWLDARLTRAERKAIAKLVSARIDTRKPAPYLVNRAWIKGHPFYVDERVIVPRSFIGELLDDRLSAVVADPDGIASVLDLCTGSGCLAILAALKFPDAKVDAADISADALDVAARNVAEYGLADRVSLVRSDLFAGLGARRYDLIISNPPYVTAAAVAAFPPEHRAEPQLAHLAGADGLDLVRRILAEAPRHLTPDGAIVIEVGSGRHLVEEEWPDLPFLWLDTPESEGEVFALAASDFPPTEQPRTGRRKRGG